MAYGMQYSTAKVILNIYKKEGRFNKKKERARARVDHESHSEGEGDERVKSPKTNPSINRNIIIPNDEDMEENDSLLRDSFWAKKITEYFRHKDAL